MKTSTKKPRAKKNTVKETPSVVYASGDQCFWSCDGHILASLYDLEHALSCIEQTTYNHHVTSDRNDFANWVEFVLCDKECADGLRRSKTQRAAHRTVTKSLSRYIS